MIKVYRKDHLRENRSGVNHNSFNIEYQLFSRQNSDSPFGSLSYVFNSGFRYYLVMPFVRGGSLNKVLQYCKTGLERKRIGTLSEDLVRFYTVQLVFAVNMLHEQDILHRDLQTSNLVLD